MKRRGFIATAVAGALALLTGKLPSKRVTDFKVTLPEGPALDANWVSVGDDRARGSRDVVVLMPKALVYNNLEF